MADSGEVVVGVDIGTSETKAVAVDTTGSVIARSARAHEASVPQEGWVEHDAADVWWRGFTESVRGILAQPEVERSRVAGVACTGIGPCVLAVDQSLEPLRPAILYGADGRAAQQVADLTHRFGAEQIVDRCGNPLSSQSAGPKIMWLHELEPEIHARAAYFLTCQSYVAARLTDAVTIDHTTGSYFHPLYDQHTQDWNITGCEDFVCREQLGELRWPTETAGAVTVRASQETGLPVGTPVAVGTADAPAEALASGTLDPGDMMVMYGSSSFVIQVSHEPDVGGGLWSAPYVFPGTWQRAGGTATAGAMMRWAIEVLAVGDESLGPDFAALVRLAEQSPPGANGLLSLPYLSGERTPFHDPQVRGMLAGLSSRHTRSDIARAVIEGVAHSMAAAISGFATGDRTPRSVTAVGGGIANHVWLQAVSDMTGLTQRVGERRGAAYGAAMIAALACGLLSVESDVRRWVSIPTQEIEPEPANAALYADAHAAFVELTDHARSFARSTSGGVS